MRQISVTLSEEILARLTIRGKNRSRIINRDLGRLYRLYQGALSRLSFTSCELALLCEALKFGFVETDFLTTVIENILLKNLDAKWGVRKEVLLEKLRSLSDIETMALLDAIERVWFINPDQEAFQKTVGKIFYVCMAQEVD